MPSGTMLREPLCEGVNFSSVRDKKFRHNSLSINLITPLAGDTAAATALLSYLLRKGSKNYPDFTLLEQQLCELYGASLSSDVIKYGAYHIIRCSMTFVDDAYTLAGEVISDKCADLLGDMILCPKINDGVFDAADFLLEQQNLVDTIEAEINDKRAYAVNQCKGMMFAGTPLATPRYGTVAAAKKLTSAATARRYQEIIATAQIEITFVGCGDPAPALAKFRQLFDGMGRCPINPATLSLPITAGKVQQKSKTIEVAQAKLVLGLRAGALPDKAATDATKLMTTLYGGTPNSRLFTNVREKLSLCYYCAAGFDRPTGILLVDIGVEQKNRDKAQAAILAELKVLADGDFADKELAETKLACANGMRSTTDSLSAIESWYLVQILQGTNLSPEDEVAAMNAVTKKAVQEAAARVTLDSVYFLTGKEVPTDE